MGRTGASGNLRRAPSDVISQPRPLQTTEPLLGIARAGADMRLRAIRRLSTIWRGAGSKCRDGWLFAIRPERHRRQRGIIGRWSPIARSRGPSTSQTGFELAGVVSQPLRKRKGSSELSSAAGGAALPNCLLAVIPPRTYDRPSLQSCENAGGVDLGTAREIVLCSAD